MNPYNLEAANHPCIPNEPKVANPKSLQHPNKNTTATTIEFSGLSLGQIIKQSVGVESSHDFLLN